MKTLTLALLHRRLLDARNRQRRQLQEVDGLAHGSSGKAPAELSHVHHALAALEAGEYGSCLECGGALEVTSC